MTKKKSKFMTFIWSLIPGAGEMYLGFFRQGVSLMAVFFVLLGISGFLRLAFLAYLAPIVWFYSFFHANNLNSLSDEEFYAIEDDYLIHWNTLIHNQKLLKKHRKLTAACLILFGAGILWSGLSRLFLQYLVPALNLTDEAMSAVYYITELIPQCAVAIAIIAAGIYLIRGKYEELNHEDSGIPSPPYLEDKNRTRGSWE